jgi:diguanylate cyclase (GGDEF)-like protein
MPRRREQLPLSTDGRKLAETQFALKVAELNRKEGAARLVVERMPLGGYRDRALADHNIERWRLVTNALVDTYLEVYRQEGIRIDQDDVNTIMAKIHRTVDQGRKSLLETWRGTVSQDVYLEDSCKALVNECHMRLQSEMLKERLASEKASTSAMPKASSGGLDPLLQIFNRGHFDSDLAMVAQEAGDGRPLSLVMIDLDHFKEVNDRFGHPVGDEVLKKVATVIKDACACKGKCYRYGGEEVAVLLPNYSPDEGLALAERLRIAVSLVAFRGGPDCITASMGVATIPLHSTNAETLVKAADAALYRAKRLGRNLVRLSGEAESMPTPVREVKRRLPDPGGLSDGEKLGIRLAHFRGEGARCPRDDAILKVIVAHSMGKRTPDLIVCCPLCGVTDTVEGD